MLALDWWFIKELQFFYCYSFELNSLTLCLLHCLVRQSVISDTNQISRPLPFNAERTTNRETRDGEEFWVLCDCYLNADMECSVGACAAQLRSIEPFMNIGTQSSTMILLTYLILLQGPTTILLSKILHISLCLDTHWATGIRTLIFCAKSGTLLEYFLFVCDG